MLFNATHGDTSIQQYGTSIYTPYNLPGIYEYQYTSINRSTYRPMNRYTYPEPIHRPINRPIYRPIDRPMYYCHQETAMLAQS